MPQHHSREYHRRHAAPPPMDWLESADVDALVPERRARKTGYRTNRHHIHPLGSNGPDVPENIVVIDARLHDIIHSVFGCMPPSDYLTFLNANLWECCRRAIRAAFRHFGSAVIRAAIERPRH